MAKEKTDSNKQGRFARWRDRRKANKLRAREIGPHGAPRPHERPSLGGDARGGGGGLA